ncbi:MAG TPA: twin-arginine translocase TatA/TatE family subunit [Chloroflexota bacterium]|nr:twin-arginine translocase TatA/TatE family subunit [Chloroflexota bacterium]
MNASDSACSGSSSTTTTRPDPLGVSCSSLMGALQPAHLILILAIVLVIFEPRKLGDIGKSLGEGMRELRKAAGEPGTDHSPSESSPRMCAECHSSVRVGDRFCGQCGRAVPI